MNKAIILDRDGTINIDKGYLYKIEDFEFLPGTLNSLKKLQEAGYLLIIVTNQSGIARGYYTEDDYNVLNEWMIKELRKSKINIAGTYFCPHHPNGTIEKYKKNCNCRKPKTQLIHQAIKDFNIDIHKSYAVGDRERDVSICKETDMNGFVVYAKMEKQIGNISHINSGLEQVTEIILKREKNNG